MQTCLQSLSLSLTLSLSSSLALSLSLSHSLSLSISLTLSHSPFTCIPEHVHTYITLHYIALHYITLHRIKFHYIRYITLHCCITLHYITDMHTYVSGPVAVVPCCPRRHHAVHRILGQARTPLSGPYNVRVAYGERGCK